MRCHCRFIPLLIPLLLFLSTYARADTIHVPQDFPTIQEAIDAASDGDTILVSPGRYVENIDFKGKEIVLKSTDGCASTIIDGNRSGSVVTIFSGETSKAVLEGFTITNGYPGTYGLGGGVRIDYFSSPTIRNNVIAYNEAWTGGGILVEASDSLVENNLIAYNKANFAVGGIRVRSWHKATIRNNIISHNVSELVSGGGIAVDEPAADIINNIISYNEAIQAGGIGWVTSKKFDGSVVGNIIHGNKAKYNTGGLDADHLLVIRNNVISDNTANKIGGLFVINTSKTIPCYMYNNQITGNRAEGVGGGISFSDCYVIFVNNTVSGNHAGWYGGGMDTGMFTELFIRNSIIWGNHARMGYDEIYGYGALDIQYSDIRGGWPGEGNIDADPLFVDPGRGDYHLQYGSPCIDAGTTRIPDPPGTDFEGDPRVMGHGIDMGADEFSTHLYFIGTPSPGSLVTLKITGEPGARPVGVFASEEVLDPPLLTPFGEWYLQFPVYGPILLGPIPSDGVTMLHGILPPDIPNPSTLNFQAYVFDTLTNLSVMKIY